jgi:hypothetical protein
VDLKTIYTHAIHPKSSHFPPRPLPSLPVPSPPSPPPPLPACPHTLQLLHTLVRGLVEVCGAALELVCALFGVLGLVVLGLQLAVSLQVLLLQVVGILSKREGM